MINVRKIARYDIDVAGDSYRKLCELTLQRIDPPSIEPGSILLDVDIVFHSDMRRARESFAAAPAVQQVPLASLREIPFDLTAFASPQELRDEESKPVRRRFKEHFIADTLPLSRKEILNDCKTVLRTCLENSDAGKRVAVLSHSFRMKILEAYIRSHGLLYSRPELLSLTLRDDEETYGFGTGFDLTAEEIRGVLYSPHEPG